MDIRDVNNVSYFSGLGSSEPILGTIMPISWTIFGMEYIRSFTRDQVERPIA